MNWAVYIHRAGGGFVGVVFVRTREEGRAICRALSAAGCSGFVTRPDAWRERNAA